MLHYATLCEDWERVVTIHLHQHDAAAAIRVLEARVSAVEGTTDWTLVRLLENCSCELMDAAADATFNLWQRVPALSPVRLLPALMRYHEATGSTDGAEHKGIRYLIQLHDAPPVVHDILVLFHAQRSDTATLLNLLSSDRPYGPDYAFRVCRENCRREACVLLLQRRGSYQEAVTFALQHDLPQLARQSANLAEHDDDLRRRLLLQVLAVDGASLTVHDCMRILADSAATQRDGSPLLRLEHVLPLLDDFVVVNDLKSLVCESLAAHGASCAELRKVLESGVGRAKVLKGEIRALRDATFAHTSDTGICAACDTLVDDASIVFPCTHSWHAHCLQRSANHEELQCPLCSEAVVEGIDEPFVVVGEVF